MMVIQGTLVKYFKQKLYKTGIIFHQKTINSEGTSGEKKF